MTRVQNSLSPRERILTATIGLLTSGGVEAVSARTVSAAAGVQATTIYRQFRDMQGLLYEVASYGFAAYLATKTTRLAAEDPVDDLRLGWDLHVEFGLTNPALYTLMYGNPRPGAVPMAAVDAASVLRELVQRVAEAGRLRVSVDHAAQMIHSTGVGVVLTLLATPQDDRDATLSTAACEAVLAAVTTQDQDEHIAAISPGRPRAVARAVGLRAVIPDIAETFTAGEQVLLIEWLDRIAH